MAAGPTIFTVGHGTRPIEEFLSLLHQVGVRRLVDVRTAPGSRRHPQFGRTELGASLEAEGIEYVWRKDLGGWRKPVPDSPNTSLRSAPFRGYADYMATDGFRAALAWLIQTSDATTTAIMCAETLWWKCHRRMIADALVAGGYEVVHLGTGSRPEPHVLNPAARLEGDRLVYDGPG